MPDRNRNAVIVVGEMFGGVPRAVSVEAVHAARVIADAVGGMVVCAVLGRDTTASGNQFQRVAGIDLVVGLHNEDLELPSALPWTTALSALVDEFQPRAILIPGSITGRDYAPRLAARLGAGLASDCVHVAVLNDAVVVQRAVLGGRLQTALTFASGKPAVISIAPGAFPKPEIGADPAPVETREINLPDGDTRVRLLGTTPHSAVGKALGSAEMIVSGGRGLGKPENFSLIEELSTELGATVGTSGAVVGAGWRPHSDQVGSTGHTVSPRLYLAVGISGAPQHLVGMQGSEYIVAINRDPDAPIFGVATFGIVGDLFAVVPILIRKLKEARIRSA